MNLQTKLTIALLVLIAFMTLPLIGGWINFSGQFPSDFFTFPTTEFPAWHKEAGFSWLVFSLIATGGAFLFLIYLMPQWFGFKKVEIPVTPRPATVGFPKWFWLGVVLHVFTLVVIWGHFEEPKFIINWAVIPLFWGFIFFLDGIVYRRTGGKSLIEEHPQGMIGLAVASIGGWLLFEYLNFFVGENWVYIKSDLIGVSQFYVYAIIGSAGLMPLVFEWYSWLSSFEKFRARYSRGVKISISTPFQFVILFLGLLSLFLVVFVPNLFFGVIWLAPILIFGSLLAIIDVWTPFTPIARKGNWSPLALMILAAFIQGFFWEGWNYFTAVHTAAGIETLNPDFWVYSVPYVNRFHIFEMPVLGFLGYLPFGLFTWLWWLLFAFLLKTPTFLAPHETE